MSGERPTTPIVTNTTLAVVNTENTIQLPGNTIDWLIRVRNPAHSVKVAFVATESGSNFMTLDSSVPSIRGENVHLTNQQLFVQSPDLNAVVEVLAYA